jgi:hypothetical protein
MGHASMDKIPTSPHSPSPLPLPLLLLATDFTNPYLINKYQKITAARSLSRVDSFDTIQKDIFPPTLEKSNQEPVFCNEKAEKVDDDEDIVNKQCDDTISFSTVGESVRRVLGFGFDMINSKFDDLKSSIGERTMWSAGASALFLGMVMYVRKRDRRERQLLMLLLEEKDQVIDLFLSVFAENGLY